MNVGGLVRLVVQEQTPGVSEEEAIRLADVESGRGMDPGSCPGLHPVVWVAGGSSDGPDWRRAVGQEVHFFFPFTFCVIHILSHEQVQTVFSLKVFR